MSCFSCFKRAKTPPNQQIVTPAVHIQAPSTQTLPPAAINANPPPPPNPAAIPANVAPPCPQGGVSKSRARRAFPFEESFLDIWAARIYLSDRLGKNCFEIQTSAEGFVLLADRDLTDEELTGLKELAGARE